MMNTSSSLTVAAWLWQNGETVPGLLTVSEAGVSFETPSGLKPLGDDALPLHAIETAVAYNTYLFIRNGLMLYLADGSAVQLTLERRKDVLSLLRLLKPGI